MLTIANYCRYHKCLQPHTGMYWFQYLWDTQHKLGCSHCFCPLVVKGFGSGVATGASVMAWKNTVGLSGAAVPRVSVFPEEGKGVGSVIAGVGNGVDSIAGMVGALVWFRVGDTLDGLWVKWFDSGFNWCFCGWHIVATTVFLEGINDSISIPICACVPITPLHSTTSCVLVIVAGLPFG